jgi:hypothetical protein
VLPTSRRCVTAGEDGAIRFYDLRSAAVGASASVPMLTIPAQPAPADCTPSLTRGNWVSSAQVSLFWGPRYFLRSVLCEADLCPSAVSVSVSVLFLVIVSCDRFL